MAKQRLPKELFWGVTVTYLSMIVLGAKSILFDLLSTDPKHPFHFQFGDLLMIAVPTLLWIQTLLDYIDIRIEEATGKPPEPDPVERRAYQIVNGLIIIGCISGWVFLSYLWTT
jgi:hypothetical protein